MLIKPLSADKRSKIMSAIRSSGNSSTELAFAAMLRQGRLSGWRRHTALPGKPDFVFRKARIAIFVDGCFWHACERCSQPPKQNKSYWGPKLNANKARDRRVTAQLRSMGWRVVRIWEHELQHPARALSRVRQYLKQV